MTRLNKDIKEDIVKNAIIKAKIPEKREELRKRRQNWIELVRLDAIGGMGNHKKIVSISKRFKKSVSELPECIRPSGIFGMEFYIYLNVNGCRAHVNFSGKDSEKTEDRVYKVSPHSHTLKADNPLCGEFMEMDKFRDQISQETNDIRSNVRAVLSNVGTIKKLIEIWPESKILIPKDLSPKVQLPAISVNNLNIMVGLA